MGVLDRGMDRRSLLRLGGAGLGEAGLTSLAACSSPSNSSTTLKLLINNNQQAANALQKRLQPAVTKLDKKLTLSVQGVTGTDWNDFFSKVLTQIAAGSPPDIVGVPTEGVQLMAAKDIAVPLDDYVKRDMSTLKSYFSDVHPSLVEAMMYQGHLYLLPVDFNAGNMFLNMDVLQKAGVDYPDASWTLDDFHTVASKLAGAPNVNPFDWVVRLWGSWTSFMYANNANLLEQGSYSGGDWLWSSAYAGNPAAAGRKGGPQWGQPTANAAGTVEALQYMAELKKQALSPSPDVGGGSTLQGLFASNRIGMAIGGGFWAGGLSQAGMKNGSFDVQLFPKWQSQKHLFGTGGFAIFQSSTKKDAAWELVKLTLDPDVFDLLYPDNVSTPARKSLLTAERYATTGPKHWSTFYDTLENHPDTAPIPAPPYYNALATSLNRRTTQAISTGNAKAALDAMQTDLEQAIKQAGS